MRAEPPLLAGAVQETTLCVFAFEVADTEVGAPGVVAGVTALLALDALPVPTAFVAVTVKVYAVPFVRPVTVIGELPPVPVNPPGLEVTVYEVIALPPLLAGGVNETVTCPLPLTPETLVGAPGVVAGTTELLVADALPVPAALVAVTVNV